VGVGGWGGMGCGVAMSAAKLLAIFLVSEWSWALTRSLLACQPSKHLLSNPDLTFSSGDWSSGPGHPQGLQLYVHQQTVVIQPSAVNPALTFLYEE
jgi:hypothetical protein